MFALNSKSMKSSDPQSFDLLWIRCLVVMILKTKNGATYTLSSTKLTSKRRPRGDDKRTLVCTSTAKIFRS